MKLPSIPILLLIIAPPVAGGFTIGLTAQGEKQQDKKKCSETKPILMARIDAWEAN